MNKLELYCREINSTVFTSELLENPELHEILVGYVKGWYRALVNPMLTEDKIESLFAKKFPTDFAHIEMHRHKAIPYVKALGAYHKYEEFKEGALAVIEIL